MRPLQNTQLYSGLRNVIILPAGIYKVFRGLKLEPGTEIGQKGTLCKDLKE